MRQDPPGFLKIGFISKLNGYNGELVLATDQDGFFEEQFLFINSEGIPIPFSVEDIFEKGGNVILKLEGIHSDGYAARFLKQDVFVLKKKKTGKKNASFSSSSLQGYHIIDALHGDLGPILRTDDYPQQLIAVCHFKGKEILIPLNDDFITGIDEEQKRIQVELPPGLIEIYLNP